MAAGLTEPFMVHERPSRSSPRGAAQTWQTRAVQKGRPRMGIETILMGEAEFTADNMQRSTPALEAELREVEKRKIAIDAKLNAAKLAQKRLLDFRPRLGADFQCPRCWVQNETRSRLAPIPSGSADDILRCRTCGEDFHIPSR